MTDEIRTRITHLIEEIKAVEPLVEDLHSQIINRSCQAAREKLVNLSYAAQELREEINQQDFMFGDYVGASELGDLCTCERCKQLREARA